MVFDTNFILDLSLVSLEKNGAFSFLLSASGVRLVVIETIATFSFMVLDGTVLLISFGMIVSLSFILSAGGVIGLAPHWSIICQILKRYYQPTGNIRLYS